MPRASAIAAVSLTISSGMSSMRSQARTLARATVDGDAFHGRARSLRNSASLVEHSTTKPRNTAAIGSRGVRSYHAESSLPGRSLACWASISTKR